MQSPHFLAGILALGVGTAAAGPASAGQTEAPVHTVRAQHDGWQVRDYAPTIEARVTVDAPFDDATGAAFRVLAGYIFGGNASDQKIAMTTPVSTAPVDAAPVDAAPVDGQPGPARVTGASGATQWTVAFTMPAAYALSELPAPRDSRVRLAPVPGRTWAARPFSGWMTAERADAQIATLRADLAAAGLSEAGAPVMAQYDPPWIPGRFRRNEIRIPVAPSGSIPCDPTPERPCPSPTSP